MADKRISKHVIGPTCQGYNLNVIAAEEARLLADDVRCQSGMREHKEGTIVLIRMMRTTTSNTVTSSLSTMGVERL